MNRINTFIFQLLAIVFLFSHLAFADDPPGHQNQTVSDKSPIDTVENQPDTFSRILGQDTLSNKTVPELDSMVVSGSPLTSYSVSSKTLKAQAFTGLHKDIASVLQTVSGIMVRSTGGTGDYTDISIRGSSSSMVEIYLDGIPLNSALGGSVDISKISLNSLQEIRVYKSSSPLTLMGKNAGGVINLTSDSNKDILSAIIETGSFGYTKGGALLAKNGPLTTQRISLDFIHSNNDFPYKYDPTPLDTHNNDATENTMDNRHFTMLNTVYHQKITFDSSRHRLETQISYHYTDNGIFYYITPGTNDGYVKNKTLSLVERYSADWGERIQTSFEITGSYRRSDFQRKAPYFIGPEKKFESHFPYVQGQMHSSFILNEALSFKGLVSGSYDGFKEKFLWNKQTEPSMNPYAHRLQVRGGLETETFFRKVISTRLAYVHRYERDSSNGTFSSHGKFTLNPKRERSYHSSFQGELVFFLPGGFRLTSSGTYNTRNPSLYEKFGRSTTAWGNSSEKNDSLYLKPEARIEADMSIVFSHKHLVSTLTAHRNRIDNKIKYIGNAQGILKPQNIEEVRGWGVEWDVLYLPFPWLSLTNTCTYMENIIHTKIINGYQGMDEPLLPRFKNRFECMVKMKGLKVGHSFLYSSSYFIDPNNEFEQTTKPELYVFFTWEMFQYTTLTYRIENYLDARNYDFVDKPKPGRMHFLNMHFDLSQ